MEKETSVAQSIDSTDLPYRLYLLSCSNHQSAAETPREVVGEVPFVPGPKPEG